MYRYNNNNLFNSTKQAGLYYAIMICAFIIVSFLGQTVLSVIGVKNNTLIYIINSLFSFIAMLGVKIYADLFLKTRSRFFRHFKKFKPKYLVYAVMFFIGMFLGFGFINTLIAKIVELLGGSYQSPDLNLNSPITLVLFSIFLALLPAVAEETFFRGLLQEGFAEVNRATTAFCISLAFALYHGSIVQLVYQFIFALGLSFLVFQSGSIVPSIIAHFLNNFCVLIIEYFKIPLNPFNPLVIILGLVILLAFVLLMFYDKDAKTKEKERKSGTIKQFWLPFGLVGAGICVLLIISGMVSL